MNLSNKIHSNCFKTINLNNKIKDLCKLSDNRVLVINYHKPYFKIYDENFNSVSTIDNITQKNEFSATNYQSITSNQKNLIYLTTTNSIIMTDFSLNLIKTLTDSKMFKYLSNIAFSAQNECLYVCDCSNKRIHVLNKNLEYLKKYKFIYEPLRIEILNDTVCVIPQYDTVEINCLHLYDLNTFNFKFNFTFNHHGPIGTIGSSHFCLYDYKNTTLHLIQQNGYFSDSVDIEIDKKKFHLCDRILDLNKKMFITSSINEKIFYLDDDLF